MEPVLTLQTLSQNPKSEQWGPGGVDEDSYFAITFSWQIFGNRKEWHPCPEDEDWLLVSVRVRAEESARETVMETLLCQPGKQLLSYFWTLEPLSSHGRRQSEHLTLWSQWDILYMTKFYERLFYSLEVLSSVTTTVFVCCRPHSPLLQLHVDPLIQPNWRTDF